MQALHETHARMCKEKNDTIHYLQRKIDRVKMTAAKKIKEARVQVKQLKEQYEALLISQEELGPSKGAIPLPLTEANCRLLGHQLGNSCFNYHKQIGKLTKERDHLRALLLQQNATIKNIQNSLVVAQNKEPNHREIEEKKEEKEKKKKLDDMEASIENLNKKFNSMMDTIVPSPVKVARVLIEKERVPVKDAEPPTSLCHVFSKEVKQVLETLEAQHDKWYKKIIAKNIDKASMDLEDKWHDLIKRTDVLHVNSKPSKHTTQKGTKEEESVGKVQLIDLTKNEFDKALDEDIADALQRATQHTGSMKQRLREHKKRNEELCEEIAKLKYENQKLKAKPKEQSDSQLRDCSKQELRTRLETHKTQILDLKKSAKEQREDTKRTEKLMRSLEHAVIRGKQEIKRLNKKLNGSHVDTDSWFAIDTI